MPGQVPWCSTRRGFQVLYFVSVPPRRGAVVVEVPFAGKSSRFWRLP